MKTIMKVVILFVCLLLTLTSISCKEPIPSGQSWKVIVLGEEINTPSATNDGNKVYIPLTAVLSGFGFAITWENNLSATIVKENNVFTLDLASESLLKAGDSIKWNLIRPPEGSKNWKYEVIEKDILLDVASVNYIVNSMLKSIMVRENVSTEIDYENNTVYFNFYYYDPS